MATAIESAMIPQRKSNKMRKNHVFRSNGSRDMGKSFYGGHFKIKDGRHNIKLSLNKSLPNDKEIKRNYQFIDTFEADIRKKSLFWRPF